MYYYNKHENCVTDFFLLRELLGKRKLNRREDLLRTLQTLRDIDPELFEVQGFELHIHIHQSVSPNSGKQGKPGEADIEVTPLRRAASKPATASQRGKPQGQWRGWLNTAHKLLTVGHL
jgi:hypothetical protein